MSLPRGTTVGSSRQDGPSAEINGLGFALDTGAVNACVISIIPAPTSYYVGLEIKFIVLVTNSGAMTVNVNGLGAKSIKKPVAVDPAASYFLAGSICWAIYDGTNFQTISPVAA
jgi:hypothetical protein